MQFILSEQEDTARLGHLLAHALVYRGLCPILLSGSLGAGKTTLIRHIVSNLPGGEQAEVSSPSFNLVNIYPTDPEVAHIDLYRLGRVGVDESLIEYLEADNTALLIEWAEYLPQSALPPHYVRLQLIVAETSRTAILSASGDAAEAWLQALSI